MKFRKIIMALSLFAAVCLSGVPASAGENTSGGMPVYQLGDSIEDFSFTACDGTSYTLSEALQEKEMVLINIWATWCGPCRNEFPYMEQAYKEYQDRVEIFALSCEATDTDDVIAEFANGYGLTFPMGSDTPNLSYSFNVHSIPTSIVVDRFGKICFIEAGSQPSADNFCRLFEAFLGDEYTESQILDAIPSKLPDVEPVDVALIADALNDDGDELTYENPVNKFNWPMVIVSDEERTYVTSTNTGVNRSVSALNVIVNAAQGDVLALEYKISGGAGRDFLTISVDGEPVKRFSGERDWRTYGYVFEEDGRYTVTVAYEKDEYHDGGEDCIGIDNVRLVSGDDADAVLAEMPAYPFAKESTLIAANEDAREIIFDDPDGALEDSFGDARYFIIPGKEARFAATLAEGTDPDDAIVYCYYDSSRRVLGDYMEGDAYIFTGGIDSVETTGYCYCYVDLSLGEDEESLCVVYFNDAENVDYFLNKYFKGSDGEMTVSWQYADDARPGDDKTAPLADENGMSEYMLLFVDQNGEPVEGVIANVCDDDTCTPMFSDAAGRIEFTYPSFAYHIQVIKVPDGYEYDTSEEGYLDEAGGETTFIVTKQ